MLFCRSIVKCATLSSPENNPAGSSSICVFAILISSSELRVNFWKASRSTNFKFSPEICTYLILLLAMQRSCSLIFASLTLRRRVFRRVRLASRKHNSPRKLSRCGQVCIVSDDSNWSCIIDLLSNLRMWSRWFMLRFCKLFSPEKLPEVISWKKFLDWINKLENKATQLCVVHFALFTLELRSIIKLGLATPNATLKV